MKEETRENLFWLAVLVFLTFTGGVMVGANAMRHCAVKAGVAHYTVNERTGETTFTYRTP